MFRHTALDHMLVIKHEGGPCSPGILSLIGEMDVNQINYTQYCKIVTEDIYGAVREDL